MRRLWRIYLEKTNRFLREAEIDIKYGCYLKAISASYFAIEHMLKALIIREFGSFPTKIGPLFSLADKLFVRKITSEKELKKYRDLMIIAREIYNHRKNVDHLDYIPKKNEAEEVLENTKLIINKLQLLL